MESRERTEESYPELFPKDYPERLERLIELAGLTWEEFAERPSSLSEDCARGIAMGRDQAVAAVRAAAELVRPARLAMIRMISARRGCLTAPAAASARILRG